MFCERGFQRVQAMFDKMQHPSKIRGSILYYNQVVMGNTVLPVIEGSEQNLDRTSPLVAKAEQAFSQVKTATKVAIFAASMGLAGTTLAQAGEKTDPVQLASSSLQQNDAVPVHSELSDNPAFQTMIANGFEAGDRGADQPNRFESYVEQFMVLTRPSQEFILKAFTAGKLTEAPAGKDPDIENGKLAVNLINLVIKMEVLALFVETREIPENGKLPRIDTILDRLIRKYPDTATVITPDMQARIADLEAEVDRVLDERLAENQTELAEAQARNERLRAENEELRAVNKGLEVIVNRMQALYNTINT